MTANANGSQERLLPKASTALDGSVGKDSAQGQDTFDRTRDDTKSQGLCVVFVPSLHVECQAGYGGVSQVFDIRKQGWG